MDRVVRRLLTRGSAPRLPVCQTRLTSQTASATSEASKELIEKVTIPEKVLALYEKNDIVYGVTQEEYLELKKDYPVFFRDYIEFDLVWDETKAAMIKYMQTGEIQPCTGAGMTNPIDRTIAKYPAATSIFVMIIAIPLSVTTFILLRKHHMRLKEDAMMKLRHETRKAKRERALLKAEVTAQVETIQELKSMLATKS